MTKAERTPSTRNTMKLQLPQLTVHSNASNKASMLFHRTRMGDILRNAVLSIYKWHFTPETSSSCIKSITVTAKTVEKYRTIIEVQNNEVFIHMSDVFVELVQTMDDIQAKEMITGFIHEAIWLIFNPKFLHDSYPHQFYRGFLDYVRQREGTLMPHASDDEPTTECIWYGSETMPYFLDWMEKTYGEGTVCRLNAALEAPYDETVFEDVTGTSIQGLWKMYCASMGEEGREEEELNAKLSALWRIPKIGYAFECDLEHEGIDFLLKTINPTDALTKAALVTLNHLYTPQTVPIAVKEFCLVLRSDPMEDPIEVKLTEPLCELVISVDWIKSKRPSADCLLELLICYVSHCYSICNSIDNLHSPSSMMWGDGMSVFLLLKEGLIPLFRERPAEEKITMDQDTCNIADFLFWIETTVGDGTMRRFNNFMSRDDYDPSWFVELSGKTLEELVDEYRTAFPSAELPEELERVSMTQTS